MQGKYLETYQSWMGDPEAFWKAQAERLHWFKPADKVFDAERPVSTAAGSQAPKPIPATTVSTAIRPPAAARRRPSSTTAR